MDGDYIPLYFEDSDHPYYIRGHISKEKAQKILDYEESLTVKSIAHKYGRCVHIGYDHKDAIDGMSSVFRVLDAPRCSYYKITECEVDNDD